MARKEKLVELTRKDLCTLRNSAAHHRQLSAISVNAALETNYGVSGPYPMIALEAFDVTKKVMPDVMHDMFEGGFAVVLHQVLKGLTSEGTLTLLDFNRVALFKVGFNDKKNKPEELPSNCAKDQRALKGTASRKWCLFRLLPLMLASSIPEGNAHWEVYLMYREITDMVLAPQVPVDFLPYLRDRIQAVLRAFSELYTSAALTPKLHYLVHYPRLIQEYGPLQQYWCMKFESKHEYFKNVASKTNIPKSLSSRHQLLQSYELHTYILEKQACASGLKEVDPTELHSCAQSLISHGQVWEAKSADTSRATYRDKDVLIMNKTTELCFAQVNRVYSRPQYEREHAAVDRLYDPEFLQEVAASGRSVVKVWGAVSYQGLGPLYRIEGRLTSENYCNILDDVMLPYVLGGPFPDGNFFIQQDLSPVHTAGKVRTLLEERYVRQRSWPPKGADMNIIEHIWGLMKRNLAKQSLHSASTDDLWNAVEAEWNRLRGRTDIVEALFQSLPSRIACVLRAHGCMTRC
ncbi:hypothetical protein ISCGN_003467 [Ixodes scapularis]